MYYSHSIIRNLKLIPLRWAGYIARMERSRNAYRVFVGKPEGKRPSGRTSRRWEDDTKKDLKEVGCDARICIEFVQDRDHRQAYVMAVMNLRVPQKQIS